LSNVKPIKVVAAALMLAVGVSILTYAMSASEAAQRDFICYWATGQQLVHHADPYDGQAILQIENSIGSGARSPFFMSEPPTAFFIALPLGFLSAKAGAVLWSLAIIACLMASIRLLWILNGRPPDRLHLVGYLFPPALACLLAGHTGIFLLFGVVLFLYFHDSKPYLAGAALIVLVLKPQLFLPFDLVLLLWVVAGKRFRIATGALTAIALSIVFSLLLDHSAWSHYAQMRAEGIDDQIAPTVSFLFQMSLAQNHPWVQFIPTAVACAWAVRRYLNNHAQLDWQIDMPLLLLVSIMTSPNAWFTDEAIVLPAILYGLYQTSNAGRSLIPYCCVAGVALIEVFANVDISSGLYIWTAPAWLLWYLSASRSRLTKEGERTAAHSSERLITN
jgi:Glycosyltransferase family 87